VEIIIECRIREPKYMGIDLSGLWRLCRKMMWDWYGKIHISDDESRERRYLGWKMRRVHPERVLAETTAYRYNETRLAMFLQ
jgi:hypothetical protein